MKFEESDGSRSRHGGMEVNNLEVEEKLSTMATLCLGGRCVDGQMEKRAAKGVAESDLRTTDMEAGEEACRSRHVRKPVIWAFGGTVAHHAV